MVGFLFVGAVMLFDLQVKDSCCPGVVKAIESAILLGVSIANGVCLPTSYERNVFEQICPLVELGAQ